MRRFCEGFLQELVQETIQKKRERDAAVAKTEQGLVSRGAGYAGVDDVMGGLVEVLGDHAGRVQGAGKELPEEEPGPSALISRPLVVYI